MSDKGFIKIDRKVLDWEWYQSPNTMLLLLHCILKANHTDKKWKGMTIKRGQFVTSLESLSIETGLSKQNVRTSLKHLIESEVVNVDTSTHHFSLITIVKYGVYQDDKTKTNTPTNTPITHRLTPTKETKETKETTNSSRPTLEQVEKYIEEHSLNVNAIRFFNYYESRGWKYRNKPIDYKQKLMDWHSTERTSKPEKKDEKSFKSERAYTHEQLEKLTQMKLQKGLSNGIMA